MAGNCFNCTGLQDKRLEKAKSSFNDLEDFNFNERYGKTVSCNKKKMKNLSLLILFGNIFRVDH